MSKTSSAYKVGKTKCGAVGSKIVPPEVYTYDEEQLYEFMSGLFDSDNCLFLPQGIIYRADSFILLSMIHKLFQTVGIDAELLADPMCIMIDTANVNSYIASLNISPEKQALLVDNYITSALSI